MPTYPRYLTYRPNELEARLRELDPTGQFPVPSLTAVNGAASSVGSGAFPGRSRLVKSHSCPVAFPDGQEGTCTYTRGGPAWHQFRFTHQGTDGAARLLPVLHMTERVGNDLGSIEEAAKRLASLAYTAAIRRERTDYFQRASEGGGRKRRPERCQMKMERAKQLAGRYAVCQRVGNRLLPASGTHEHLDDANAEWRTRRDRSLVVACCNRLDRCWELPRFNPLYAEFDPWQEYTVLTAAEAFEAAPQQAAEAVSRPQATLAVRFVPTNAGAQSDGEEQVEEQVEDDWEYLPGPDESDGDLDDEEFPDGLDEEDEP